MFTPEILQKLNRETRFQDTEIGQISSGITSFDEVFGGYKYGTITSFVGQDGIGKTAFLYHAIASAQSIGEYAAYLDVPHTYQPDAAASFGVNNQDLLLLQAQTIEEAFDVIYELIQNGVKLICMDTIALLSIEREVNESMNENTEKLYNKTLRKKFRILMYYARKYGAVVLWTNPEYNHVSYRQRITRYYSSQKIQVEKGNNLFKGHKHIGHKLTLTDERNRTATVKYVYGEGILPEK